MKARSKIVYVLKCIFSTCLYILTYLFVLVEELSDKGILPHDLTPQDGVEAGDVSRLARHHLVDLS